MDSISWEAKRQERDENNRRQRWVCVSVWERVFGSLTQPSGFHAGGSVDRVSKKAVTRHRKTHDPGHTRPWKHRRSLVIATGEDVWVCAHAVALAHLNGSLYVSGRAHLAYAACGRFLLSWGCSETCWRSRRRACCRSSLEGLMPPCRHRRWSPPGRWQRELERKICVMIQTDRMQQLLPFAYILSSLD